MIVDSVYPRLLPFHSNKSWKLAEMEVQRLSAGPSWWALPTSVESAQCIWFDFSVCSFFLWDLRDLSQGHILNNVWRFPQNQLPGHFIWDINTYFLEFHLQSIWVYLHLVKFTKLKHTSSAVPQRNQAGHCFNACDFFSLALAMACSLNSFKALCSGIVFIPTVLKISRHTSTLKTQTSSSCLVIFVVLLPSTT